MELKKIDAQEFATLPNFDVEYEDSAYAGEMSEKAYNVLASACDNAHSGYFEEMLQDLYLRPGPPCARDGCQGCFCAHRQAPV